MITLDIHSKLGSFDLNLAVDLPDNCTTVLYGPSGSGKSSSLDIIAGFSVPSKPSSVVINQHTWLDKDGRSLPVGKRRVAYVTQRSDLFDHMTVEKNLLYAATRASKRPNDGCDFSLTEIITRFNLNHLLHKKAVFLSGGEKQRVSIARALLSKPLLLLLDEPFAALDDDSREQLCSEFQKLTSSIDIPIIFVSHRLDEVVRLADYVVAIDKGSVVAHGDVAEMLSSNKYTLAINRDACSIVNATVSQIDKALQIVEATSHSGCRFQFTGAARAQLGDSIRLQIYAKDVSVTLSKPSKTSILNIIPAQITQIKLIDKGYAVVTLNCSGERILARITQKSVRELALTIGHHVFAQIKGVALLSDSTR